MCKVKSPSKFNLSCLLQFNYGEDSLSIMKTQFLKQKQFPFLIKNKDAVISDDKMRELLSKVDKSKADKLLKKVSAKYSLY